MKKMMAALAALVMMMTFALAEEIWLGDYSLTVPGDVQTETVEDVTTCIRGRMRTVVQLLPQQVKADPLQQLQELIKVYDPAMKLVKTQAPCLVEGVIENSFGEGLHQYVAMALTDGGLLILSAYHLDGDNQAAEVFLAELLDGVMLNGAALLPGA